MVYRGQIQGNRVGGFTATRVIFAAADGTLTEAAGFIFVTPRLTLPMNGILDVGSGTLGLANGGITRLSIGSVCTFADAVNLAFGSTTGTKIATATTQKLSFYNATPIVRPSALTTQLTTLTHTAPGVDDFAIQDLTNVGPFGFVTKDEGNTVLKVIANQQTRLQELENRLASASGLGLIA